MLAALKAVTVPYAPKKLSWDQAIQIALMNRPEIAFAEAQVGAARARLGQAHSGMMPNILLQGVATDGQPGAPAFGPLENPSLLGTQPLSQEGMAADPLKKQHGAGLTINQTIFDFGRSNHLSTSRFNLMQAAKDNLEVRNGVMSLPFKSVGSEKHGRYVWVSQH